MVRCQIEGCPGYKPDFLSRLITAVDVRSKREFGVAGWTTSNWAVALAGEVGELCNFVKKEFRDGPNSELDQNIEDEIADVFIYLIAISLDRGMNLEEATVRKFNITSKKRGYRTML